MTTRAERRHQKRRNLQRWRRIVSQWKWLDSSAEWIDRMARKYASHGKLCSCDGCGNKRKSEGPTLQERRHEEQQP